MVVSNIFNQDEIDSGLPLGAISVEGEKSKPGILARFITNQKTLFLIVGIANTVIGLGWFVLFSLTTGIKWGYISTLLFTHILSVLSAFVMYRVFVFKVKKNILQDLFRFELTNLFSLGVNFVLLIALVSGLKLEVILAQVLIVSITTIVSYFGHKYFSFRRKKNVS